MDLDFWGWNNLLPSRYYHKKTSRINLNNVGNKEHNKWKKSLIKIKAQKKFTQHFCRCITIIFNKRVGLTIK